MEKLFCIPCGGTSSSQFMEWNKYFDNSIQVIPIEIPGRGAKANVPPKHDVLSIAEELSKEIIEQANGEKYSLFGFCFGGLVSFEICRILEKNNLQLPEHLFICGSSSPEPTNEKMHDLFFKREECRKELPDMFYRLIPPQFFPDEKITKQLADKVVELFYAGLDSQETSLDIDPSKLMFDVSSINDLHLENLGVDMQTVSYLLEFANAHIASLMNDECISLKYYASDKSKEKCSVPTVIISGKYDTVLGDSWKEWYNWLSNVEGVAEVEQNHFKLMWDVEHISKIILNTVKKA